MNAKMKILTFLCIFGVLIISATGAPIDDEELLGNIHYIEAGTDMLNNAVASADSGDIIELVTSDGLYLETSSVEIENKKITVRASAGLSQKPVIKNDDSGDSDGVFKLKSGGSLTLEGVEFQHAKYLVRVDNDSTANAVLKIDDCTGHTAKEVFVKVYSDTWLDSLIVTNSIFQDCEKNGFYMKEANTVNFVQFENVTVKKAGREAIIIEDNPDAILRVNHCTFDSISWNDDRRIIYPKEVQDVEIKNSIFSNQLGTPAPHSDATRIFGSSSLHHCNFYNAGGVSLEESATLSDTLRRDPEYTDPANMNYTLASSSMLLGQADDGLAIGDLKWDPGFNIPEVHYVEAGMDGLNNAVSEAASGDIIELITSGGLYLETESVEIENKKLTIRAKKGLSQKPVVKNEDAGDSDGVFRLKTGGSLNLKGVEFQHAKYLVRVDNDSTGDAVLKIDDCIGHTAKEVFVKVYSNTWLDSLIVTNSIFRDCEKNGFYMKEANTVNFAKFENVTIKKAGREAIIIEDNPNAVLRVNHCTFDSISWNDDRRIIYPKEVQDVEIKNSIFSNQLGDPSPHSDATRIFGNSSLHHCNFYNAGGVSLEENATLSDTIRQDPQYYDPAAFDYRLADSSPARGAADDGLAMGDLRWAVSPDAYYLTVVVEGKGNVSLEPAGGVYEPGTEVTITTHPEYNWKVSSWVPATFPPDVESRTVTMDDNKEIKVTFEPTLEQYSLDVATTGEGHVEFDPAPLDSSEWTYYDGTEVTMTAVSDTSGMEFTGWTGDTTSTENPLTVSVDSTINIEATFTPIETQFALDVDTVGLGEVILDPEPYLDYGTYDSAAVVNLIAQGLPGYEFQAWSGDTTSTEDTLTIEMNSDLNVTATFTETEVVGGRLEVDTSMALSEAVEFAYNNTQVDTLVLITDGGVYPAHEFIEVNFDLAIVAKEGLETKPKIEGNPDLSYASGVFQIKASDDDLISLYLRGLEVCGAKYQVRTDDDSLNTSIKIDDCYFHDAGEVMIKIYKTSFVDTLIVTNSMLRECVKEGIYMKEPNTVGYVKLENSTFVRTGREAFRMRDNPDAVVRINHCTFDSISYDRDYRMLYPEDAMDTKVMNSIFTNQLFAHTRHEDFLRLYGENSTISNCVVYNASGHVDPEEGANIDTTTIWEFDPLYENPSERNYTLLEESHAYDIGTDGHALGDLNWATEIPTHVFLNVNVADSGSVVLSPEPVGKSYDPNTEVTLTAMPDSGYNFINWSGDISGEDNPVTVTVEEDMDVTATFEKTSGIEDSRVPVEYSLSQNYPNPFNPSTTISFGVKKTGFTTLKVYDVLGREVASFVNRQLTPGFYNINFNEDVPSGVYFYKLRSGNFVKIRKMMLLK